MSTVTRAGESIGALLSRWREEKARYESVTAYRLQYGKAPALGPQPKPQEVGGK